MIIYPDRLSTTVTKNKRAKLTTAQKEEIKRLFDKEGYTNGRLAKMFEVSTALISQCCYPDKTRERYLKKLVASRKTKKIICPSRLSIAGTKHDKRAKLTADEKEEIKRLYEQEGYSNGRLATMFEVTPALITYICHPEKAKKNYSKRKAKGAIKKSSNNRKKEYYRELRELKRELLSKGELQDNIAPPRKQKKRF